MVAKSAEKKGKNVSCGGKGPPVRQQTKRSRSPKFATKRKERAKTRQPQRASKEHGWGEKERGEPDVTDFRCGIKSKGDFGEWERQGKKCAGLRGGGNLKGVGNAGARLVGWGGVPYKTTGGPNKKRKTPNVLVYESREGNRN